MKRKLIYLTCLLVVATGYFSCKKFLNVPINTNSQLNPSTVEEYEEILNSPDISQTEFFLVDLTSDDIIIPTIRGYDNTISRAYAWAETLLGPTDNDNSFNTCYRWIMHMNFVVNGIDNAPGGTQERKAIAKAQAKIHRAYFYLQLVNIYAPGYNATTATTDLGVPLVLNVSSNDMHARATVQQVYDQIQSDLNDALNTPELPDFMNDIIHPGKAAAKAMQARMYLLMGNYTEALAASEDALAIKSTLLDYNTVEANPRTLLAHVNNPEIFLPRVGQVNLNAFGTVYMFGFSLELASLLGPDDWRLGPIETQQRRIHNFETLSGGSLGFDYSITVAELMLIKAECLARNNNGSGAMQLVNQIRQNRVSTDKYVPLNENVDGPTALQEVLKERRRELFMHGGLRLFDVKRLGLPMKRTGMYGEALREAPPQPAGSKRFILPFSARTLSINTKIIQNER